MKTLTSSFFVLAVLLTALAVPALADDHEAAPLFINLTTDDPHSANMAIAFGKNQMERGHPLTIFLNDRGVMVGDRGNSERFARHQETLAELIEQGADVLICMMCMRHFGVAQEDLMDGLQLGNPELTGGALFKPGSRSLTW